MAYIKLLVAELLTLFITQRASTPSTKPVTEQRAKVTVTKVGHQAITVPANDFHGALSTDYYAVYATITNQSQNNQTYTEGSFYAITDSGVTVKIPSFGPGIDQTVWRRADIAPNGQADVTLLFPIDQKIATLVTTIPDTSDLVTTPLPLAQ